MKISAKQQDSEELYALTSNSFTPFIWQLMRISLLSIFLLFISFQLLMALNVKGQVMGTSQVTIGLNKEPFMVAIKEIEKQTKFRFFYRKADVEELKQLNLSTANRSVEQTLYELLKNTAFTYKQIDLNILIERKKESPRQERKISGKIYIENTQTPIAYAVVELLKSSDSTLVAHSYTDTAGSYHILANSNSSLLLRVSGLGYQSYTTKIEQGEESVEVPKIYLKVAIHQLKEIAVSGNRPLIQRKSDRFVVNVANSSLSVNNTVWDVLKQVPLVNADDNGALSITAKQGAVVYINGRKSNLTGQALFNYLKSLPSTTLSDIEIVTSPGSEFDASGNAGILNIIFKKRESDGYQGSFSLTDRQANYNSQVASAAFNYRKSKLGVNLTPYYNRDRKWITERHDVDFLGSQTQNIFNFSTLYRKEFRNFYGGNLGIEYNLTPRQTITGNLDYNPNHQTLNWVNNSLYLNKTNQKLDSSFVFTNDSKIKGHSLDGGLNYQLNLDTLGQSITASVDYFEYTNNTSQKTYATVDGTGEVRRDEIATLPQKIKNYTFALDYKLPIGANTKLKLGARSFNTSTNNNLFYKVANTFGNYIDDQLRSTSYRYEEQINAIYASADVTLGKNWSATTGLRLEQASTKGRELIQNKVAVDKDYLNLFPMVAVNYTPNVEHAFSFTLSKRIERPVFWQLNNLRVYVNPTQYVEGNPFLQSSYILKNEFSYTLKSKYIFLLSYSHITDNFSQFVLANNNDNITRVAWLNYGTGNIADLTFVANLSIGRFIKSSVTLAGSYVSYKGKADEEIIDNHGFMGNFKMNNTVVIAKKSGVDAYVNFSYITPRMSDIGTDSKFKSRSNLTVGFRKTVNQFVFTLSGADLLKSSANISTVRSRYATVYNNNYFDARSISLNVRYNFGNSKLKKNKPQENVAQDVINRTRG
ncbi:TonB-dependent receptor domain-containing protein [Pedobacter sp. Hv1]|uniref:TonB-dependent receptor domain-containing protein n=1 Tax=Pedobacter sp. Hv1 TaxID=1740090 RepID=UPI0006D8C926|nr:TonB-dependent receptor [Pedobacter sp. Hv1]KQC00674.1 hypothetical protein AQF98_08310 [Pedobacter sp. Hv1]